MEKWKIGILVFALCAVIVLFRFTDLKSMPPGFFSDEAYYGNNAVQALETGDYKVFYRENHGREGLYINIATFSLRLFGNEPWALRGLSAAFGALTAAAIFLLAKELFGSFRTAFFAGFLTALSFWHVLFSRIGFRAISAPFFLAAGFYFLLRAFRGTSRAQQIGYALLSGILLGAGFHAYIAYRVMPLLLLATLFLLWRETPQEKRRVFFSTAAVLLGTIFLVGLPIGIYFLEHPNAFMGRSTDVSIFRQPVADSLKNVGLTLAMFNIVGDWNWRHNLAGKPLLWWPVGIFFLIGVILSIKSIRDVRRRAQGAGFQGVFLLAWLTVMLIPNLLSPEGSPHALRALVALPAVFLLAALGMELTVERGKTILAFLFPRYGKVLGMYLLAWFFLVHALVTGRNYFLFWAQRPEVREAFSGRPFEEGMLLRNLPRNIPKYVVHECSDIRVQDCHSAQTILFLLGGWNEAQWKRYNTRFISEQELQTITAPSGTFLVSIMKKEWVDDLVARRWPDARRIEFDSFTGFRIK